MGKIGNRNFRLLSCSLILFAQLTVAAPANPASSSLVLDKDGNVRSFYGIPVTLTRSGLKGLPFAVKQGHYSSEGERYTNYTITAQQGVELVVAFADDGRLSEAETVSPNAVGPKEIGVGSTLADVRRAWPDGMFLYGFADGYYVTYVTGTNVLLRFDWKDMPPGAFDHERPYDFPVPDNIKVEKISVYPEPHPVTIGRGPIDPNESSITVSTAGKIISKLDVDQTPGSSLVRLTWTHQGKTEADRVIDVSQYPNFDVWSRHLVRSPNPVVVSFRYGRFKDCGVRWEDRDKVYVTLKDGGATVSSSPPPGVALAEGYPMPKYVGNSMKSAAHGCRRTYDPQTGAFGLERDE